MKYILFLFILFVFCYDLISQGNQNKSSFTFEVGMPPAFGNESFKGIVKPIVYLSPFYQRKIKGDFALGLGFQHTYWQINEFKVPVAEPVEGGIHNIGIYLKPFYEKDYSDFFGIDFGVKLGYSQTYFNTDINDSLYGGNQQVESLHVAPTLAFVFRNTEENNAYRFTLGYHIQGVSYSPSRLGLSTKSGYDPAKFSNPLSYLVVGFGYTHYFK